MVTRMTLTRAELVAAHMAMNFLWIEHGLERDPEAAPLLSALMKFYYAVRTWDGEDTVKLVCVAGENTRNKKQIGIEAAAAKAKVKREVLVHWKCFCRPPAESCSFCRGSGHLERWMPAKLLAYLKGGSFSIVARRPGHGGRFHGGPKYENGTIQTIKSAPQVIFTCGGEV